MSGPRVIRVVGDALGRPTEHDGCYLVDYDVDARDGRGEITTSPHPDEARRFDDGGAALEAWRTVSTVSPTRPDGKPNRPLTAFTVSIEEPPPVPPISLGWLLVWHGAPETEEESAQVSYLARRLRGAGCTQTQGGNDYLAGYGPVLGLDRLAAWIVSEGPRHWRVERVAPWKSAGPPVR